MQLLKNVRGLTCCELPEVEECCGFGGTFSVKMPGTSLAMGRTKAANVVRSGAEVLVSPDISCLMHLGGILRRDPAMRHIRTMHIAEVLVADGEVIDHTFHPCYPSPTHSIASVIPHSP